MRKQCPRHAPARKSSNAKAVSPARKCESCVPGTHGTQKLQCESCVPGTHRHRHAPARTPMRMLCPRHNAESYVGMYGHIIKDPDTNRSELLSLTAQEYREVQGEESHLG
jgi:hypothetical protein